MSSFFTKYSDKSIRLTPDGFSFFRVLDNNIVEKSFSAKSNSILSVEYDNFFANSDNLTVICSSNIPILIPAEIFDENKLSDYLKIQYNTSDIAKIYYDTLGEYFAVYFISNDNMLSIEKLPVKLNFCSESKLFYDFLIKQNDKCSVLISQNESYFDLLMTNKGRLQFLNRFQSNSSEDIIYYLLYLMKQYNLREPQVYFLNNFDSDSKAIDFLQSNKINVSKL